MTTTDPRSARGVDVVRVAEHHYRARTASGAEFDFGSAEGLPTPVELLLAAIAGCSAIDVDTVASRRTEPENFSVRASGNVLDEDGAKRLDDIALTFELGFPDNAAGRAAAAAAPRSLALSHDKYCTVSRTVEHATAVTMTADVTPS